MEEEGLHSVLYYLIIYSNEVDLIEDLFKMELD